MKEKRSPAGKQKEEDSYLDLLVGRHSAKDDLRETLRREHPKADPPDHAAIFDERQRLVLPGTDGEKRGGEGGGRGETTAGQSALYSGRIKAR